MQTVIGELDVRVVCRERFRSSTSHTQTYTAHGTRHTAHNTHFHRLRRLRQKVVAAVVAVAVALVVPLTSCRYIVIRQNLPGRHKNASTNEQCFNVLFGISSPRRRKIFN